MNMQLRKCFATAKPFREKNARSSFFWSALKKNFNQNLASKQAKVATLVLIDSQHGSIMKQNVSRKVKWSKQQQKIHC